MLKRRNIAWVFILILILPCMAVLPYASAEESGWTSMTPLDFLAYLSEKQANGYSLVSSDTTGTVWVYSLSAKDQIITLQYDKDKELFCETEERKALQSRIAFTVDEKLELLTLSFVGKGRDNLKNHAAGGEYVYKYQVTNTYGDVILEMVIYIPRAIVDSGNGEFTYSMPDNQYQFDDNSDYSSVYINTNYGEVRNIEAFAILGTGGVTTDTTQVYMQPTYYYKLKLSRVDGYTDYLQADLYIDTNEEHTNISANAVEVRDVIIYGTIYLPI